MLPFQNFQAWVAQQSAAVTASATALLNLTVGSVLRAILEANASVALWMQWLILLVLQRTRLATSSGVDVDSWVNDFGLAREAATSATGSVTFSRATTGQAALIPVGAQVKTLDGTQTFSVTVDTTNTAYSAASSGYIVGSSVASLTVPIVALTAGTGGNVLAGAIGLMATAVPGVSAVTNAAAFTDALAAETDGALRARFLLFIASLASAVPAAIEAAAFGVQQGVKTQLANNYPLPGFFTLFVDDGSGDAPTSFINAVFAAVQSVTAEGVQPTVIRPTVASPTVNYSLTVTSETGRLNSVAMATAAATAYIAALGIGAGLNFFALSGIITGADPNITGLNNLTVNGVAASIAGAQGVLIANPTISGS